MALEPHAAIQQFYCVLKKNRTKTSVSFGRWSLDQSQSQLTHRNCGGNSKARKKALKGLATVVSAVDGRKDIPAKEPQARLLTEGVRASLGTVYRARDEVAGDQMGGCAGASFQMISAWLSAFETGNPGSTTNCNFAKD